MALKISFVGCGRVGDVLIQRRIVLRSVLRLLHIFLHLAYADYGLCLCYIRIVHILYFVFLLELLPAFEDQVLAEAADEGGANAGGTANYHVSQQVADAGRTLVDSAPDAYEADFVVFNIVDGVVCS